MKKEVILMKSFKQIMELITTDSTLHSSSKEAASFQDSFHCCKRKGV